MSAVLDFDDVPGPVRRAPPELRAGLVHETARNISIQLNHAVFGNYHIFRPEVKVNTQDFKEVPPAEQGEKNQ
jgi:hypothetical protein